MIQNGLLLLLVLLLLGATKLLGIWAFLVLLGGIMSYLGDHVGTYVGKKRLALFGIRPRHTAVLISLSTGTVITLLTLGGAVLISADYREALLGVKATKEEGQRLARANLDLQSKGRELAEKLSQVTGKLEKAESELRSADQTRRELAADIDELKTTLDSVQAKLKQERRRLTDKETKDITVEKGAPLLRRPLLVPLNVGRAELKVKLLSMLAEIREAMQAAGMDVPPTDPAAVDQGLLEPIYLQAQEIAREFKAGDPDRPRSAPPRHVYLRATSLKNLSLGEKLSSVHFDVKPNRVVYAQGEEIASTPIDGRQESEQLLQQLFNFDRKVQEEMHKRGVLAESLQRRIDRISAGLLLQFVKIVDLAKDKKAWVTLRMLARNDILAFGQIDTEYDLAVTSGASPSPASSATPRTTTGSSRRSLETSSSSAGAHGP